MRKYWLIQENEIVNIISNRGQEPDYAIGEADPEVLDAACYDLFKDEDGTYSALINETKAADYKNKIAKREYELRKQS